MGHFDAFGDDELSAGHDHSEHAEPGMAGRLMTAEDAIRYMTGGKATVTFKGKHSRFTFKISLPTKETPRGGKVLDRNADILFVGLLSGPDNTSSYQYLGDIRRGVFFSGRKSRISREAPASVAFRYSYGNLARGVMPAGLEVWHEGSCGRCGRALTVPSSIANGIGPECAKKTALGAMIEDFAA